MTTAPAETKIIRSHPWEPGLGIAPFRFVKMTENRYDMGHGQWKPGGTCDYCGTGILYEFHCVSSDGRKFKVGCDCIARCHTPAETIVTITKKALKEYKRVKAGEGRAAKRKAEAERRQAKWEAERLANIAKLASDPLYARLGQHAASNDFAAKMRNAMERFGSLTEKQEAAIVATMDRADAEPARKAASRHLGTIGARVQITGTVEFTKCIYHGYDRFDPDRWLNKVRTAEGALVVWFGGYSLKVGAPIAGTASVKDHSEFSGEKQTVIKNPRWKDAA